MEIPAPFVETNREMKLDAMHLEIEVPSHVGNVIRLTR